MLLKTSDVTRERGTWLALPQAVAQPGRDGGNAEAALSGSRIFLTGATGYLGNRMAAALVAEGHALTCLVRAKTKAEAQLRLGETGRQANVTVLAGDLTEAKCEDVLDEAGRQDIVLHLAAQPKLQGASYRELRRVHVEALERLATAGSRLGAARFFHFSTAFVTADRAGRLGEGPAGGSTPANVYERTKSQGESILVEAFEGPVEVFRPGIVLPSPEDGREELAASPLGFFFRGLSMRHHSPPRVPALERVRPGFCWRDDVIRFCLARLGDDEAPCRIGSPAVYWNLVSDSPTMGEMAEVVMDEGVCGDLRLTAGVGDMPLRAWGPYLQRQRTWDVEHTVSTGLREGAEMRPVTVEDFRRLCAVWADCDALTGVR